MSKRTLKSNAKQRVVLANVQASARDARASEPEPRDADAIAQAAEAINAYHAANVAQARESGQALENLAAQVEGLNAALEQMSADTAATRMGGGGPRTGRGAVSEAEARRQMASVADFARTGHIQAAMSTDSNPDGGYAVPEVAEQTLDAVLRNESPMRNIARVQTITQGAWKKGVWIGGAAAVWTSERASRPETATPTLVEITIPAEEIYCNPALTQNLVDDAFVDIASELINEIGISISTAESAAFVTGDGVQKPKGLLTYPVALTKDATRPFGTIQYVKTGAASSFVTASAAASPIDAFKRAFYSLKVQHRKRSSWLMSSTTLDEVSRFKDAVDGQYIVQRSDDGEPTTLLGRPISVCEDMPDVAAGNFPIALADWQRAYVIVDRKGVSVLRDPYTKKPYVLFYTTKRVGGGVFDTNAIKLLQVAA